MSFFASFALARDICCFSFPFHILSFQDDAPNQISLVSRHLSLSHSLFLRSCVPLCCHSLQSERTDRFRETGTRIEPNYGRRREKIWQVRLRSKAEQGTPPSNLECKCYTFAQQPRSPQERQRRAGKNAHIDFASKQKQPKLQGIDRTCRL